MKNYFSLPCHSPDQIRKICNKNQTTLQNKSTKDWIRKRYSKKTANHYSKTSQVIKAEGIIKAMFDKLDTDGEGTLDIGEITGLFQKNRIHMTNEQVADLFAEAKRAEKLER